MGVVGLRFLWSDFTDELAIADILKVIGGGFVFGGEENGSISIDSVSNSLGKWVEFIDCR